VSLAHSVSAEQNKYEPVELVSTSLWKETNLFFFLLFFLLLFFVFILHSHCIADKDVFSNDMCMETISSKKLCIGAGSCPSKATSAENMQ
jgi:hypothetical protein